MLHTLNPHDKGYWKDLQVERTAYCYPSLKIAISIACLTAQVLGQHELWFAIVNFSHCHLMVTLLYELGLRP